MRRGRPHVLAASRATKPGKEHINIAMDMSRKSSSPANNRSEEKTGIGVMRCDISSEGEYVVSVFVDPPCVRVNTRTEQGSLSKTASPGHLGTPGGSVGADACSERKRRHR